MQGLRKLAVRRRRKTLDIRTINVVHDGSGLKVFGAGEWCMEKHGRSRRRWRKLSIGLDPKSSEIVAHKLSDCDVSDPSKRAPHIKMIREHRRMAWQKTTDYGRRSLIETAFGRYSSIIEDGLKARDDDAQMTEVAIGIKALNRMTRAAKSNSVRA
ncbi:MAG: hypothetical protein ACR2RE_17115 [Geminicoccaceae bacterium]